VLINRQVRSVEEAESFLSAQTSGLLDPYSFLDMHKACGIIRSAAQKKKKILLFGDYDVDGITSVVILKNALEHLGISAMHYIPHRINEGYGLNKNSISFARQKGAGLIITADCGINSIEEVKELRRNNIEVIVTDHHEPGAHTLTEACAVINPKVRGESYKFRDLAGVGVAYKLCQALLEDMLLEELDLVCLGTIADVVPLKGENRVIAREGLLRISDARRTGIRALIESSGLKGKKINSYFVSYILAPRINSSGRMDSAEASLELLMSRDRGEADELAKIIEGHNRQRQKIESKIMDEAEDIISREINFKKHKVIVLAKEGWHRGVLGVVASKIADKFYRPTIVFSKGEEYCKGSGRSIKNFHLFRALGECSDYLLSYGGHSHAVGVVIEKGCIDDFRSKINRLAEEKLRLEDLFPALDVDMELKLADLNEEVISELDALEPFGTGNPEPLFYSRGLRLKGSPLVLGRETLKFWVTDGSTVYPAIAFGMSSFKESLKEAGTFELVYTPRFDSWQGNSSIILETKEIFFR